ncbi:MAG: hypothetical protein AB7P37_03995 [Ramlibacter sp.]
MQAGSVGPAWAAQEILVVEHATCQRGFYQVILDWVKAHIPECSACFDLRVLDENLAPLSHHKLMVPWLQDPVQAWSAEAHRQALALTLRCDAAAIPVINRVERLAHAAKATGARLMRDAGLRTPRNERISDIAAFRRDFLGLRLPLLVREDWGHGGAMLQANTPHEARLLPLETLTRPVAAEVIDLPDPHDALYRKYRYVVAGNRGVPHHLQASRERITRGGNRVTDEQTTQDELAYINAPCPHHDAFMAATRLMGLDFVAFDYGLDACGQPVVWEANPFPYIQFSQKTLIYRNVALHRTIGIIVAMYLERAGLELPARLASWLDTSPAVRTSAAA